MVSHDSTGTAFDYDQAFARNLGWVTREEQARLRGKRVAIAGMGGVGGVHLLTLARLGVGSFSIADFDRFDWANFNRQVGATVDTVGRPKVDVLAEMGAAPARLVAVGGGARNRTWLQVMADIGGMPQEVPETTVGASYGDAMLAGPRRPSAPPRCRRGRYRRSPSGSRWRRAG